MTLRGKTFLVLGFCLTLASSAPAPGSDEPFHPELPEDQRGDELVTGGVPSRDLRFIERLGEDFQSLASTENLLILGVGSASAFAVRRFDSSIAKSSFSSEVVEGTATDALLEGGEVLGGGLVQGGGALTLYGMGKLFSSREAEHLGGQLVRAQLVSFTLTHTLKASVGRARPDGASRSSFPSGHTSSSFATATVLHRRYGWKAGVPAFGLASYVAASRMSEGRHYLSDVLFGAVVGLLSGRAVTIGTGSARFALAPVFVPGGGGVELTWLAPERAP